MFGFLVIDKPPGPSSHDVVAAIRRRLPRGVKVGHAGTLDPFARGVLVVCVGAATRLADYVQARPKRYRAVVRLGVSSSTDDPEGEMTPAAPAGEPPGEPAVREALARFVGVIEQVPPAHSAVHVDGRRAYKLARKGEAPELPPRTVTVHAIDLVRYEHPLLEIDVRCASGTYIRALARDVGAALGTAGYCEQLTRTGVGPFRLEDAAPADEADLLARLLPPLAGLPEMPRVVIDAEQAPRLRKGKRLRLHTALRAAEVAVLDAQGSLLALAAVRDDGRVLQPTKVFPAVV